MPKRKSPPANSTPDSAPLASVSSNVNISFDVLATVSIFALIRRMRACSTQALPAGCGIPCSVNSCMDLSVHHIISSVSISIWHGISRVMLVRHRDKKRMPYLHSGYYSYVYYQYTLKKILLELASVQLHTPVHVFAYLQIPDAVLRAVHFRNLSIHSERILL